ncbi:hypothetical protein BC939DRAFT_498721 [Gamsiella multidivaricata]|uniref:uncharacterized protein n=1 Tax=Gamsiella multidivaricata TaxID=101098 RepID=UPI00221EA212|nr:uncharacterized protein BC939DRAFT_498721 [Gamsiella multidivaricata]KAI7831751.1 hypothetical protein BC939DRAFT_498721 [Gamsiella multidivaricata]
MLTERPLITPSQKPKVLIVGAGLCGLTLGILLEKAGVPYDIYERMTQVKPLGSALSLGPNVAPLFIQMGIYDEFIKLGKMCFRMDNYNDNRELEFSKDFTPMNEHGVQIQFSDNSTAEGDILVEADGAYSGVREQPYSWGTFPCENNIYCWGVIQYLGKETSKEHDSFRNLEWGPDAAQAMCKDVRDFAILGGVNGDLTIGDLIENSPLISKVMLEEKVFETWYHGRTVLMGDAAHKDAAALANWIGVLSSTSIEDTEEVFEEYRNERLPVAKAAFASAQALLKLRTTIRHS